MKEYDINAPDELNDEQVYVLIIYDIVDNKRRNSLVSFLQGYGYRVQKSCFEALLQKRVFNRMKEGIKQYASEEDSIRIYKIHGKNQVTCYGNCIYIEPKEIIII